MARAGACELKDECPVLEPMADVVEAPFQARVKQLLQVMGVMGQ